MLVPLKYLGQIYERRLLKPDREETAVDFASGFKEFRPAERRSNPHFARRPVACRGAHRA
jgi:hypothetical protein